MGRVIFGPRLWALPVLTTAAGGLRAYYGRRGAPAPSSVHLTCQAPAWPPCPLDAGCINRCEQVTDFTPTSTTCISMPMGTYLLSGVVWEQELVHFAGGVATGACPGLLWHVDGARPAVALSCGAHSLPTSTWSPSIVLESRQAACHRQGDFAGTWLTAHFGTDLCWHAPRGARLGRLGVLPPRHGGYAWRQAVAPYPLLTCPGASAGGLDATEASQRAWAHAHTAWPPGQGAAS